MRETRFRGWLLISLSLGAVAGWACEPLPGGDGRFWSARETVGPVNPKPDAGSQPDVVDPEPEDAAIPPVATGSGGGAGSGEYMQSGGSTGSGGNIGSGGVTASGGRTGSGGEMGSGGRASTGGASASGGNTNTGGSNGGGLTGTLKVTVTTTQIGGKYAPRNVGAIWIADSGTKFVKSLYVWAQQRRSYLSHWSSATSAAGLSNNVVDAVTGATIGNHGTRTATWNGTNTSKVQVPDGAYKVCFELSDGSNAYQCVDFNKSRNAQTLNPANTSSFNSRSIGYTP